MLELLIVHFTVLGKLYLYKYQIVIYVFLAGTALMSVYQYIGYRMFIKKCVKTIKKMEDEDVKQLFEDVISETGNSKEKARIYQSVGMMNPFVMGINRPAVILPELCNRQPYLKTILLHECFHVKRRDTLYKLGMLASNCLLWFHPLAYLIRYFSYQDIEISCDEAVLQGKSEEERLAYGEFLIHSVRNMEQKSNVYNTYWNSNKRILKNRIDAVVNKNRKWDIIAKAAIVFLILQVVASGSFFAINIWKEYTQISAPANEYKDVEPPKIYDDQAIQKMLMLEPVDDSFYNVDLFNEFDILYPEKELAEIDVQAETPWQFKVGRPATFGDAADVAIQRFYYYLENQTGFCSEDYELSPYITNYEVVYSTILAGDVNNFVWGYVWKVYCSDVEASNSLKDGYAFVKEGEDNYLYFATAVQIQMVKPYLFEVVGYADLYKTIEGYKQKYSFVNYFDDIPKVQAAVKTQEMDLSKQEALANKAAEIKNLWDVRISFPENDQEGYMLAVADKAMMQVYCVLYKTEDGGKSWAQIDMNQTGTEHSVVYDFAFINQNEGYMAIHSFFDNPPCMLRTLDAGLTWEEVSFMDEPPMDFCQAFPPVWDGEKYIVYIGKEGSSKNKGEKACYETNDGGKNWNYTGQVTFD